MAKTESFTLLPNRVILSKHLNSLTPNTRWLFVVMLTEWRSGNSKAKAFTFPYRQLREITGYKLNTISVCITRLEKAGLLVRLKGGLEGNPNRYIVNYDWLELGSREAADSRQIPSTPIEQTTGKVESLAAIPAMSLEAALNIELDIQKFY